jgi:hypothetical protein
MSPFAVSEQISWLGDTSPAIDRLGIPTYRWWSEALHGVATSPGVNYDGPITGATSFPEPIGIASAFDRQLVHDVASAISTEARAMNNQGQAGLTYVKIVQQRTKSFNRQVAQVCFPFSSTVISLRISTYFGIRDGEEGRRRQFKSYGMVFRVVV